MDVFEVVEFLEVAAKADDEVGEVGEGLVGVEVMKAEDLLVVDPHTPIPPIPHPLLPLIPLHLTKPIPPTIILRHYQLIFIILLKPLLPNKHHLKGLDTVVAQGGVFVELKTTQHVVLVVGEGVGEGQLGVGLDG